MSNVYNVAVVVGSLRKASINRKVALALAELAPANLKLSIVEIFLSNCEFCISNFNCFRR